MHQCKAPQCTVHIGWHRLTLQPKFQTKLCRSRCCHLFLR